ncbi:hypothetical protein C0584_06180 [Candidatus Parcubacteria bacterium]|nr:MAG: hypothetical protein C0584_06180 [Candidatus Parcubacteria bacterium]
MNKKIKKSFLVVYWVFILFVLLNNGLSYLDPDLGWHLRVGEEMVETKNVPKIEHYDHTLEGVSWVDHEWGINIVSYLVYDKWGYSALNHVFALLALFAFYLLYRFVLNKFKTELESNFLLKIVLLSLIMLGVFASLPHLGVRMQEITILNSIILLIILDRYSVEKSFGALIFLPFLFVFWANVHAGFMIGLVLLIFFIFVKTLEMISYKFYKLSFLDYKNLLSSQQIFIFSIFSILSFFATLIGPYGIGLYDFLKTYSNDFYLQNIKEWLPFYRYPIKYKQLFYAAVSSSVVVLFFLSVFSSYRKKQKANIKIEAWQIFIFVLFLYLSLKSKRHFPLFFVFSLPLIFFLHLKFLKEGLAVFRQKVNLKISAFFVIAVVTLLVVNQAIKFRFIEDPFRYYCNSYPCGAKEYLADNPELQNKKIYNNYNWGGYFIWTLPDMKLFIDGRLPQYNYDGRSLLEEYRDFLIETKVDEMLSKHEINLIILKTSEAKVNFNWFEKYFLMMNEEKENNITNHLKEHVQESEDWEEIYSDQVASIYAKI